MNSSAEGIAKMLRDLLDNRVAFPPVEKELLEALDNHRTEHNWNTTISSSEVIDSTMLYMNVLRDKEIALYEDANLLPVWEAGTIGFQNDFGNVKICTFVVVDMKKQDDIHLWESDVNEIDWDRVRWVYLCTYWIGGSSKNAGGPVKTMGPVLFTNIAVYEDGTPADIHWINVVAEFMQVEPWTTTVAVVLQTITFANCTNVVVVEPSRPRPLARRIARTGIKVSTIHLTPFGTTRRHSKDNTIPGTLPLTSVRGHKARYGPKYGRGLLFGKYEGVFWIPQHARGERSHGETKHVYQVEPEEK